MKVLGMDIGTTSISAVVLDADTGKVLETDSIGNRSRISSGAPWESLQDPDVIVDLVRQLAGSLLDRHRDIQAIGVDAQMHGIVYVGADGRAVSPLYTWQDRRGEQKYQSSTYADFLSEKSGYPMRPGYGLTTHFWHVTQGTVPKAAARFCSIGDYAALRLTGTRTPVMHCSNAESFGMLDPKTGDWDRQSLEKCGMTSGMFPEVTSECRRVGTTESGIPVFCAIGDNQASLIGSVREPEGSALINMGTGGQISMAQASGAAHAEIESRPLNGKDRILVGSALCGGRAYAIMENMIRSCARLAGYDGDDRLYEAMNREALRAMEKESGLLFDTRFCGTRQDPGARGMIRGIDETNFTAGNLIAGCVMGMADEIHHLYQQMLEGGCPPARRLIGSGNAIRKCEALKKAFEKTFGLSMLVPVHQEEAAYGACLFALLGTGQVRTLSQAQQLIRYEGEMG